MTRSRPPSSPSSGPAAASLAAAPAYDEAAWNRAYSYETTVPNQVWAVNRLPVKESAGPAPKEAAFYSKPLFPLDGFDVMSISFAAPGICRIFSGVSARSSSDR